VPEDEEIPDVALEIDVGSVSFLHQDWWDGNPDALNKATDAAL
jgi:hypothetical protein